MPKLKKYLVSVIDAKTKAKIADFEELARTQKHLRAQYEARYRFSDPPRSFTIKRLFKKPGIQTNLLDQIKEVENGEF